MEKIFLLTIGIALLFFAIKIIEMKYFDKAHKPMKIIVRDTLYVAGAAFLPLLLFFQFDVNLNEFLQFVDEKPLKPAEVFTDEPGF